MEWPSECEEVAHNMSIEGVNSFLDARARVRAEMPDESFQIVDNVAEALWERVERLKAREKRWQT